MLRLEVFGTLAVHNDTGPLQLQKKSLLLLVVVALSRNGGISRERLAGFFWPDTDEERAANSLRQRLFVLRRELGREDVIVGTSELRLDPARISWDSAEFDAAAAAGDVLTIDALYRGPFLDGVSVRDSGELEMWIDQNRARFHSRAQSVFVRAATHAQAAGDLGSAVRWWRRAAEIDPINAEVTIGLIESLAQQGSTAAATQQFRIYESILKQELGVPPDAAMIARVRELQSRAATEPVAAATSMAGNADGAVVPLSTQSTVTPPAYAVDRNPDSPSVHTQRPSRFKSPAAGAILIVAAVLLLLAPWKPGTAPPSERIVVLPFDNQTGDTAFASISTIASDWVVQGLLRVGAPDVVDARAVLASTDQSMPELEIARHLHGSLAVSGGYFRRADSLYVQARIVDVQSGKTLQVVDPIGAAPSNVLHAVDRMHQKVMGALWVIRDAYLDSTALGQAPPPTFEAYQQYVTGLQFLTSNDTESARKHFVAALEKDSSFINAAVMAAVHSNATARHALFRYARANEHLLPPLQRALLHFHVSVDSMQYEAAYVAATRAVELAPRSNAALNVLTYAALHTRRYTIAVEASRRMDPTQRWMRNWAYFYANTTKAYHLAGRFEEELALTEEGENRFPRNGELCFAGIAALAALGRGADVEERLERCPVESIDVSESYGYELHLLAALEYRAHGHEALAARYFARLVQAAEEALAIGKIDSVSMGVKYFEARRYREALPLLLSRVDTSATSGAIRWNAMAAVAAHHTGDTATLQRHRQWLKRQDADTNFMVIMFRARVEAHLGNEAAAIALLTRARDKHGRSLTNIHGDWGFLPLEGSREFRRVAGPR